MSFILDALRKSEHARQHQKGPALAEVPIVATKPKINVWAAAAVALLIVNLIAVGVLLLRRAQQGDETPAVAVVTAPAAPVGSPADAAADRTAVGARANPSRPQAKPEPTLAPDPQVPVTQTPRGALQPIAPPASGTRNPLAAEVSEGSTGPDPAMAASAASVPAGPPAVTTRGTSRPGSVTYATVPEADDTPYSAAAVKTEAPQQEALPTADEVVARGGVPPLHLDLHVYANAVAQRFIFVNSRKYKEGETLQEGPVVERITVDGAVLNFRGSRFKLSQD